MEYNNSSSSVTFIISWLPVLLCCFFCFNYDEHGCIKYSCTGTIISPKEEGGNILFSVQG